MSSYGQLSKILFKALNITWLNQNNLIPNISNMKSKLSYFCVWDFWRHIEEVKKIVLGEEREKGEREIK